MRPRPTGERSEPRAAPPTSSATACVSTTSHLVVAGGKPGGFPLHRRVARPEGRRRFHRGGREASAGAADDRRPPRGMLAFMIQSRTRTARDRTTITARRMGSSRSARCCRSPRRPTMTMSPSASIRPGGSFDSTTTAPPSLINRRRRCSRLSATPRRQATEENGPLPAQSSPPEQLRSFSFRRLTAPTRRPSSIR